MLLSVGKIAGLYVTNIGFLSLTSLLERYINFITNYRRKKPVFISSKMFVQVDHIFALVWYSLEQLYGK